MRYDDACTLIAAATNVAKAQPRMLNFSTMLLVPGESGSPNARVWYHSQCKRGLACYAYVACSGWANTMQVYASVLDVPPLNASQGSQYPVNCSRWLLDQFADANSSVNQLAQQQAEQIRKQYFVQLADLVHWQQQTVLDHPLIGLSWSLTILLLLSLLFTGNWFSGQPDVPKDDDAESSLDSYQCALRRHTTHEQQAKEPENIDGLPDRHSSSCNAVNKARKRCKGLCHPVIGVLSLLLFVERLASSLLTIELFMFWTLLGVSGLVWLPIYSLCVRNNPRWIYCCCFCCCWDRLHPQNLWPPTRNSCKELFVLPVRGLTNLPTVLFVVLDILAPIAYLYVLREAVEKPVYSH